MLKKFMCKMLAAVVALPLAIAAPSYVQAASASNFPDLPENVFRQPLIKAVNNGILFGSDGYILPDNTLTRAQMAALVNRVFKPVLSDTSKNFVDVKEGDWFANDIAKVVKMGVLVGDGVHMTPNEPLTREQAYSALARVFNVKGDLNTLGSFKDSDSVSSWAYKDVSAMYSNGYLKGMPDNNDNMLLPKQPITRAEFVLVLDNLVSHYLTESGVHESPLYKGNVLINTDAVVLRNTKVNGNIIVADGVGRGEATLENVKLTGSMLVRGGGENSIIIKGNSEVPNMVVSTVNGIISIKALGGAKVDTVYVDDGCDDVIIVGNIKNLNIGEGVNVNTANATIDNVYINGANSTFTVSEDSYVKNVIIDSKAEGSKLNVDGKVGHVSIDKSLSNVHVNINQTGRVRALTASENIKLTGKVDSEQVATEPSESDDNDYVSNDSSQTPDNNETPDDEGEEEPSEPEQKPGSYEVILADDIPSELSVSFKDRYLLPGETINITVTGVPANNILNVTFEPTDTAVRMNRVFSRTINPSNYYFTEMPSSNVIVRASLTEIEPGGDCDGGNGGASGYSITTTGSSLSVSVSPSHYLAAGDQIRLTVKNIPTGKMIDKIRLIGDDETDYSYLLVGSDLGEGAGRTFTQPAANLNVEVTLKDRLVTFSSDSNIITAGDTINVIAGFGSLTAVTSGTALTTSSGLTARDGLIFGYKLQAFEAGNYMNAYSCIKEITLTTSAAIIENSAGNLSIETTTELKKGTILRLTAVGMDENGNVAETYGVSKFYVSEQGMHNITINSDSNIPVRISVYGDSFSGNYEAGGKITVEIEDCVGTNAYRVSDVLVYKTGQTSNPVPLTTFVKSADVFFGYLEFTMPEFDITIQPVLVPAN